jgi:GTP-binding protein
LKYLSKRQELKRAFLLVDAEHGVKETDKQLLDMFNEQGIPYQIVLSKVDKILFEGKRPPNEEGLNRRVGELRKTMEGIEKMVRRCGEDEEGVGTGEVVACSSTLVGGIKMGVDAVRFSMLRAAGLEFRPKVKLAGMVEVVPFDEIPGMDDMNR